MNLMALFLALLLVSFTACNIEAGSADMLNDSNFTVNSSAASVSGTASVANAASTSSETDSDSDAASTSGTASASEVASASGPSAGGNIVTTQNDSVPTMPNFGIGL